MTDIKRGHLLRWYADPEDAECSDYEILHPHTCPVEWMFNLYEYTLTSNGWEGRTVAPEWDYGCMVSYEVRHVGLDSLGTEWPFYGQGYPERSGLYELIWWSRGSGIDFESGFGWEWLCD